MTRRVKPAEERRIGFSVSLSGSLLYRFQQAYTWVYEQHPTEADIKTKYRELADEAIKKFIEDVEADQRPKVI